MGPAPSVQGTPGAGPPATALGSKLCPQGLSPLGWPSWALQGPQRPPQGQPGAGGPNLGVCPTRSPMSSLHCRPGGAGRDREGSRHPTAGKGAPGPRGTHVLTYGPEHRVKGAHVLPVRGEVHPGDAELLAWELLYPLGGAAPQDPGALASHVLGDQRSHLLQRVERVRGEGPALGGGGPAETTCLSRTSGGGGRPHAPLWGPCSLRS